MKTFWPLCFAGTIVCLGGIVLRLIAIWTASHNFTHRVRTEKDKNHILVKHGVYAYMRHPGYLGLSLWGISTQIILANPLCLIMYVVIAYTFFQKRVLMEEALLLKFFGKEYRKYQKSVPTGLPFIKGYKL